MNKLNKPNKNNRIFLNIDSMIGENAFLLLGSFKKAAKSQGWSSEEIEKVLTKAKSGDYDNLVDVLQSHCIG